MTKWNNPQSNDLFRVILSLKNILEARKFFRDLLTEAEIIEFSKRWQVAQMLDKGISYTEIVEKTGLSSTTVARISKWLKKGMNGYRLILNRFSHHNNSSSGKRML